MSPLVTIIVVSYNHSKFVRENLDSIKSQTYTNIQLIIADDASKDDSVEVIENWLKENNYNAVTNFHQNNTGLSQTLNECIELANGKYVQFCAADDYLLPETISQCVEKLEKLGNDYGIYYGDIQVVNENSEIIEDKDSIRFPTNYNPIEGNCFTECINNFLFWIQASLIRLDYLKATKYKFEKKYISEDWHLMIHMARHYKIAGEKAVFCYYRKLETSITRSNWNEKNMHNIYFSQFDMILSFLNHPKNSRIDNSVVIDKLLSLLSKVDCHSNSIKIKLIKKFISLILKSKKRLYVLKQLPKIL